LTVAELMLDVPLIPQTKTNSCWHASIRMVKAYAGVATKTGVQKNQSFQKAWVNDVGTRDYTGLAHVEEFKMLSAYRPKYTVESLLNTLRRFGPIWVNTTDGFTWQHAVVITGVSNEMGGDEVFINDPWPIDTGTSDVKSLVDFNKISENTAQMYYPPNAK
jgi:hypothetical protein